jgi:hypothetical protein
MGVFAMLFKRQKVDWLFVPLLAIGLFTYASYQPRFQLRPDMPAEFLDVPVGSPQRQTTEAQIAQAYWNSLVHDIQPKYGYGYSLPSDPPADFSLAGTSVGITQEDPATRIRYWRKAQHVWYLPNAWQKGYEWDFHWTSNLTQNTADWAHRQLQHLGGD